MGMAMMGTGNATGEDRAKTAAEAAISSPLLDDVKLSGAKGVLVNITAGLDMSIGEFEMVGEVIKGFITENATVVVGTVIDPDLSDEMRVTVVITGLNETPDSQLEEMTVEAAERELETTRNDGSTDYEKLQQPTVMRKQAQAARTEREAAHEDVNYLDIPAFLRKKEKTDAS
jgi:cell division protein FtsZ